MTGNRQLALDLVQENRVNFAKLHQIREVKAEKNTQLLRNIEKAARVMYQENGDYERACLEISKVVCYLIRLVRGEQDILQDIQDNLNEIKELQDVAYKKTN